MTDISSVLEALAAATAHHQNGEYESAIAAYKSVIEVQPGNAELLHMCGMAFYQDGDAAAAEPYLKSAIGLRADQRDFHSNFGLVLDQLGRTEEAIESFCAALAIDPNFEDALLNLANTYVRCEKIDEAETMLRRLLALKPFHAEANNSLGVILGGFDQVEEAIEVFRTSIESRANYADAHANLGQLLARVGSDEEAMPHLVIASELRRDDFKIVRILAATQEELGQMEDAQKSYEHAASLKPDDADCYVGIGSTFHARKMFTKAEEYFQEALNIDPSNANALNNLGAIHLARDDPKTALRCFDAVLKDNSESENALYNSGVALRDLGNFAKAVARLQEAISLNPHAAESYRCLANIHYLSEDFEKSIEVLERWHACIPDDPAPVHLIEAGRSDSTPLRASDEYVREEFDRFADTFEEKLEKLEYQAPKLVTDTLLRQDGFIPLDLTTLDAGCGTGLAAPIIRPWSDQLIGVDLSPNMVEIAEGRKIYDKLQVGELVQCLSEDKDRYGLIVCIDTFVYFGSLREAMRAANDALIPGGWIGFSVENLAEEDGDDYSLTFSGRFKHRREYVLDVVEKSGLQLVSLDDAVLRTEMSSPVNGLIVTARRH